MGYSKEINNYNYIQYQKFPTPLLPHKIIPILGNTLL